MRSRFSFQKCDDAVFYVLANALLSASLDASRSSTRSGSTIHSSKIIERALALTDLLQHEFIFTKPCIPTRQCLEQTLDRMVQEGLLVKRGYSTTSATSASSTYGVRFCLDKNQTFSADSRSGPASSHGSSASLNALEDDLSTPSITERQGRRKRAGGEDAFYLPSEDDDLADYEDEADEDDDDELFGRRFSNLSAAQRRGSYGIASLVDSEDDYNADVIRLYASTLAPILETYKFTFKAVLAELAQAAAEGAFVKSHWKTGKAYHSLLWHERSWESYLEAAPALETQEVLAKTCLPF